MNASPFQRQSSGREERPAILIFGASARAAAHSALRAGFQPIAADLFGDVDLKEIAEVLPLERYPHDFVRISDQVRDCPWIYTGGLENHPEIVERIAAQRRLWGNSAAVLRSVRDPAEVCETVSSAGLPSAECRAADNPPERRGEWLLKPLNGAGGAGIVVWDEAARDHATLERPHYFQRRLRGTPVSAIFIAARNGTQFIGVTRQLVGTKTLGAGPFSYCGSIGPLRLSTTHREQISRIGTVLAMEFELRGLFGIDLILNGDAAVPVEVNPRYASSVEVLERAYQLPLLGRHGKACESFERGFVDDRMDGIPDSRAVRSAAECRSNEGKAILFARNDTLWREAQTLRGSLGDDGILLADIPQPGTRIPRGWPICTLLAAGNGDRDCARLLVRGLRRVREHISENRYS